MGKKLIVTEEQLKAGYLVASFGKPVLEQWTQSPVKITTHAYGMARKIAEGIYEVDEPEMGELGPKSLGPLGGAISN